MHPKLHWNIVYLKWAYRTLSYFRKSLARQRMETCLRVRTTSVPIVEVCLDIAAAGRSRLRHSEWDCCAFDRSLGSLFTARHRNVWPTGVKSKDKTRNERALSVYAQRGESEHGGRCALSIAPSHAPAPKWRRRRRRSATCRRQIMEKAPAHTTGTPDAELAGLKKITARLSSCCPVRAARRQRP